MCAFLNPQISRNFRNSIKKSNLFSDDNKYRDYYNLSCAVMDRIDTCVSYLNNHDDYPKSEEEFLLFMMFGTMIVDAVKEISKKLSIQDDIKIQDEYQFFSDVCYKEPLKLSKEECPTDDKFFEYFRSLTFAHPYETSRAKFLRKNNETQYSPWVIVNKDISVFCGISEAIGVRIYSNKHDDTIDLLLPFKTLKNYIKLKYEQIEYATNWFRRELEFEKEIWKKQKINKNQPSIKVLTEIKDILKSRYIDCDYIGTAIEDLQCDLTIKSNEESVSKYRQAIINSLPRMCEMIESLNESECREVFSNIMSAIPKIMHENGHYQLEKIFNYLNNWQGKENIEWGLKMTEDFAEEFAKKWVNIDVRNMSFNEIHLLVRTACFLEKEEQELEKRF